MEIYIPSSKNLFSVAEIFGISTRILSFLTTLLKPKAETLSTYPSPRKSSGYWDLPRPTTSRFKICFTFDSLFFIPAGPWQMPRACRARVPFFMYVLFCMGRNEPLWVRVFEHGMLQLLCTVLQQQHSVIGSFPIANGGCNSTSERLKLWKWAVHQNSGENICWCRL